MLKGKGQMSGIYEKKIPNKYKLKAKYQYAVNARHSAKFISVTYNKTVSVRIWLSTSDLI